jgi:adenylate cyclase
LFFLEKKTFIKQADISKKEYYKQLRKMQELLKKNEEIESINIERQKLFRLALEQQNNQDKKLASELSKKEQEIQKLNKAQKILKQDKQYQSIETERIKNAKNALEKQGEADRLLATAQNEKNKHKQDSLHQLAKSKQAEVEVHLNEERRLQAESKQRSLEVIKEKEAKEFQQYINYLILAGLISIAIFAYYIFKSRQKEIKQKEEIMEKNEEIQQINEELNTTLQIVESERAKSDALLLNILPLETAQELKNTGISVPKHYDIVTVLFTDFKGFTNIAEKFTPTQVIEELNTCFLAFDEICGKYGLEKIKTIGDAYMCAGGLPVANESNPFDVVSAGLEMQRWMAKWKTEKEAKNEAVWELRLGIHTGEVVAGVIGKKKFAYDIWGDTVNTASRMESSGEVGKVNISGTTYKYIKDSFECTFRGNVKAKNKGEIEMYFVNGEL